MPFTSALRVEFEEDGYRALLLEDLVYEGRDQNIFVTAGYVTDFATVPWFVQWVLPRTGKWTRAAVLHDVLCSRVAEAYWTGRTPAVNAVDTDRIVFLRALREEGVDPVRRELLYMGVRLGALANPARRPGSLSTAPRVLGDLALVLGALTGIVAGVSWAWPW